MIDAFLWSRKFSCASVLIILLMYTEVSCYSSWRSLESSLDSSFENLLNDDQNFTLEDTFQNYLNVYPNQEYSKLKEDYKKADYPYSKILDIVNFNKIEVTSHQMRVQSYSPTATISYVPTALVPRISSLQPTKFDKKEFPKPTTPPCKEIYSRLYPIKGKGVDGKKYYIINVKGFEQFTDVITCHKRGTTCDTKDAVPEDHVFRCKQQHAYVELSTFPVTDNITAAAQSVNTFQVPSGCSCERYRVHGDA